MNDESIKRLLRIAILKSWSTSQLDATMSTFCMLGSNIVPKEEYLTRALLPAIYYNPPTSDDWEWGVAICTGPIYGNMIVTMPFSFNPWELRYVTQQLEKDEIYALILIISQLNLPMPKDVLKIIYKHLIR